MAERQIDGSAVGSTSTNNNIGTIRHGGTIASALFTSQSLGDTDSFKGGSQISINFSHAARALGVGVGNFAQMVAEQFVIRKVTTLLAGQANTVLRSGASDFGHRNTPHLLEGIRSRLVATAIRAGNWDIYGGSFSSDPTNQLDSFGQDDEARSSRATPGELVYQDGSNTPFQDSYESRT